MARQWAALGCRKVGKGSEAEVCKLGTPVLLNGRCIDFAAASECGGRSALTPYAAQQRSRRRFSLGTFVHTQQPHARQQQQRQRPQPAESGGGEWRVPHVVC